MARSDQGSSQPTMRTTTLSPRFGLAVPPLEMCIRRPETCQDRPQTAFQRTPTSPSVTKLKRREISGMSVRFVQAKPAFTVSAVPSQSGGVRQPSRRWSDASETGKKVLPYFFSVPLACSAFSALLMASLVGRHGGAFLNVSQVLAYLPTPPQMIPLPSLLRQP